MADSTRKHKAQLTLGEKVRILEASKSSSQRNLSKDFKVSLGTINTVLKNRDQIMTQYLSGESSDTKRHRKGTCPDVNEAVLRWFRTARSKIINVDGPMIQAKALEIAGQLGYNDFKASNGWLDKFKRANQISCRVISGESAEVNSNEVSDWIQRLAKICEGFNLKDIFNADETGLCFRALPSKTLAEKSDKCSGVKVSKDRLTVMLCASALGEKLKPLVIGKSAKPRCFKHVDLNKLGVTWRHNKKAWMTTDTFIEWLEDLNSKITKQRRKILLIIDNAPTHFSDIELSNVTVKFFPPNTTSRLQPLDQGVIKNMKVHFKRRLLQHVLAFVDDCSLATEITKKINVLDAVKWVKYAWDEVKDVTIQKCFAKAGFSVDNLALSDQQLDDEDEISLQELIRRGNEANVCDIVSVQTFLTSEDLRHDVHQGSGEDWEKQIIPSNDDDGADDDQSKEEEDDTDTLEKVTVSESRQALETLKRFCTNFPNTDLYLRLDEFENEIQRQILKSSNNVRQSTLDSWTVQH